MRSRFSLSLLLDAVRLIYETLSRRVCTEAAYVLGRLCTERHPNSQMYELARAPMSPSGRKTGGYRARSMRPAIAIGAGSRMISAWVPALDHRHPTYSLPRRLAKLIHSVRNRRDPYPRPLIQPRAQSRHATSCPAICRKRSGTSMTTNSTNCYPRSLPSRSDEARSPHLKSPSRGASKWSLPPH